MEEILRKDQMEMEIHGNVAKVIKIHRIPKRYCVLTIQTAIINIIYQRFPINTNALIEKNYDEISYVIPADNEVEISDHFLTPFIKMYLPGINESVLYNYCYKLTVYLKNSDEQIVDSFEVRFNDEISKIDNSFDYDLVTDNLKNVLKTIKTYECIPKLDWNHFIELELYCISDFLHNYIPTGFEEITPVFTLKTDAKCLDKFVVRFGWKVPDISRKTPSIMSEEGLDEDTSDKMSSGSSFLLEDSAASSDEETVFYRHLIRDQLVKHKQARYLAIKHPDMEIDKSETNVCNQNQTINLAIKPIKKVPDNNDDECIVESNENYLDCICKILRPINSVYLIKCSKCNRNYHLPCTGYLKLRIPENFSCVRCGTNDLFILNAEQHYEGLIAKVRLICSFLILVQHVPYEFLDSLLAGEKIQILEGLKFFNLCDTSVESLEYGLYSLNRRQLFHFVPLLFYDGVIRNVKMF